MKRSLNSDNPYGLAANYKPQPQTYPAAPGASPSTYGLPLPAGQPPAFNQPPPPPGVGQGSMSMSAPSTPAMANAPDPWRNYGYGNQMQRPASAHAGYQPSAPGVYSPSTSTGPSQTPSYSPQPNQSPSSMPSPAQYGPRGPVYSMAMPPPPPPPPSMGLPPRSASGPYYSPQPQPGYGGQPMPGYAGAFPPPPPPPGYQQGPEMHRAKKARLDGPPMPMSGPPPAALPYVLPRGNQNGYNNNNRPPPPPMNFNNNLSRSQNSSSPRLPPGPPGPSLGSSLPAPAIPLPPKPVVDANRPNRGVYERKGNAPPMNNGRSGPPLLRTGESTPRYRDGRRDGRAPNNQRGQAGRRDNRSDRRAATNTTGAKRNRTWGNKDERQSPHPEKRGDKVKEQRKTLTDFRIVGLEIKELDWSWKAEPSHEHDQNGGSGSVDGRAEDTAASEIGDMSVDSIRPPMGENKEEEAKEVSTSNEATTEDPSVPAANSEDFGASSVETPAVKVEANNKHARDEDDESRLEAEGKGKKIRSEAPASLDAPALPSASPASVFDDVVSVKTHDSTLHLPPANRENSRLRIYFCAPISDNGEAMNHLQKAVSKTSISSTEAICAPASLTQVAGSGLPEIKSESVDPSSEITPRIEDIIAGPDANKPEDSQEDDNEDADVLGSLTAKRETTEGEESKPAQDTTNSEQPPQDQSSPDRISISYARNSRRLILDSFIVSEIKIFRKEGRIELLVDISPATTAHAVDDLRICKGLLVEAFDPHTDDYYIVDRAAIEEGWDTPDDQEDKSDLTPLLPPLHRLASLKTSEDGSAAPASQMVTIIAHLDVDNPLSEARWVRSGETDAWSIVPVPDPRGGMTTVESGWFGKIHVADPDPTTTFNEIAHHWVEQRADSSAEVLNQFVTAQFQDVNNIIEIFLHVIRSGEGAATRTPPAAKTAEHRQDNISRAVLLGAPMPLQQTSLSLTTFLVFKLALEMATKAGVDQEEMLFRLSDIVRQLPAQTFYKALDAQYATWLQRKEDGREDDSKKE